MKLLSILTICVAASTASKLFPVHTNEYQNFSNGTACRPLPDIQNLLNPSSLLLDQSKYELDWPPIQMYYSFQSRAYISIMHVMDNDENPMDQKPKNKNKTKTKPIEEQNLTGQILNKHAEFLADGLESGRTMFKNYLDILHSQNTYQANQDYEDMMERLLLTSIQAPNPTDACRSQEVFYVNRECSLKEAMQAKWSRYSNVIGTQIKKMKYLGLQCISDTQVDKKKNVQFVESPESEVKRNITSTYALLQETQKNSAYAFVGTDAVNQQLYVFFDTETFFPIYISYYMQSMYIQSDHWISRTPKSFDKKEFEVDSCRDKQGQAKPPQQINRKKQTLLRHNFNFGFLTG